MAHSSDQSHSPPHHGPHGHSDPGNHAHGNHAHGDHADGQTHVHVAPVGALLGTFATLIILTVVTVKATDYDFGAANLLIALAIATVKAAVVGAFFMHLAYDRAVNVITFASSLLFLAIFLWFTLLDSAQYQRYIRSVSEVAAQQQYEEQLKKSSQTGP